MTDPVIIQNAIQTPDGTILKSIHVHDYQEHTDKVSGNLYMTDGGTEYIRRTIHDDQVDLDVTDDMMHMEVREKLVWGTYGKSGQEPFHYMFVKDMSIGHLRNCIEHTAPDIDMFSKYEGNKHSQITVFYVKTLKKELLYRLKGSEAVYRGEDGYV